MKLFKNSVIVKTVSVLVILIVTAVTISLPHSKYSTLAHAQGTLSFTDYPLPNNSQITSITSGPDGNLWFTEWGGSAGSKIGRITPNGTITEFPIATTSGNLMAITKGADGNLWFTDIDSQSKIGRITPNGTVTEYALPTLVNLYGITSGPDGNVWFTEYSGKIGRITPNGTITEFPVSNFPGPEKITSGPDGNLWFTGTGGEIGRITTTGQVTEYSSNGISYGITSGPDGNLWFTETDGATGDKVGRMTPNGSLTEFPILHPNNLSSPEGITTGPDGNLWFTLGNNIGQVTPSGVITEFPIPNCASCNLYNIITGPDGNLWYGGENGGVGRITLSGTAPTTTPTNTPTPTPSQTVNKNISWSGYGVQKDATGSALFKNVSSEWQVPSVSCMRNGKPISLKSNGNVWIWVGLGGASVGDTNHLEQVGIIVRCDKKGKSHYAAFFEAFGTNVKAVNMGQQILIQKNKQGLPTTPLNNQCAVYYSNGAVDFNSSSSCYKNAMPVSPGDKIKGAVYQNVNGSYSVSLYDSAWKGIFGTTFNSPGKASTAEWIVEDAHTGTGVQSTLPSFNPITFTNSFADSQSISSYPLLTQFQIWTQSKTNKNVLVKPLLTNIGSFQQNGTEFTTQWENY